jgi:hypothetical protein
LTVADNLSRVILNRGKTKSTGLRAFDRRADEQVGIDDGSAQP